RAIRAIQPEKSDQAIPGRREFNEENFGPSFVRIGVVCEKLERTELQGVTGTKPMHARVPAEPSASSGVCPA
ncbi:Unknown protein, partial [Striga hermonthica]